tara:strand:- start:416 stop:748 length:333 start_codon:yes stop_codon:yes gene_type:complete
MNAEKSNPLDADEVISCLRDRWEVTYDIQLVQRGKRLYLHLMWAYLEQKSFPLDEATFRAHIQNVVEVINRLGQAESVREWLQTTPRKPRVGKPISFSLQSKDGFGEFVL